MTLKEKLNEIADSLVPVSGELMSRACSDIEEHLRDCDCSTCKAFKATQNAITTLEQIIKEL